MAKNNVMVVNFEKKVTVDDLVKKYKTFKSKEAKEEQPENIPFILVTIFVTKVDKSIDCKE